MTVPRKPKPLLLGLLLLLGQVAAADTNDRFRVVNKDNQEHVLVIHEKFRYKEGSMPIGKITWRDRNPYRVTVPGANEKRYSDEDKPGQRGFNPGFSPALGYMAEDHIESVEVDGKKFNFLLSDPANLDPETGWLKPHMRFMSETEVRLGGIQRPRTFVITKGELSLDYR